MPTRWTVKRKPDNSVTCSLCSAPNIYIEPAPLEKIKILMEEYPNTEWLGYLKGQKNRDSGDIFVEDVTIPPHEETNGASCLAEPFHIPKEGCVGVIHSHHHMGAFHSGQDDHTVDRNFQVSITVAIKNNGLEWDAISHTKTPCGKHTLLRCPVKYVQPKLPFNRVDFLRQAKKNIDKGKHTLAPNLGDIPLIPLRYRLPEAQEECVVDSTGRVMSKKEYKAWLQGSGER